MMSSVCIYVIYIYIGGTVDAQDYMATRWARFGLVATREGEPCAVRGSRDVGVVVAWRQVRHVGIVDLIGATTTETVTTTFSPSTRATGL
jgi:hypothetical protein